MTTKPKRARRHVALITVGVTAEMLDAINAFQEERQARESNRTVSRNEAINDVLALGFKAAQSIKENS